MIDGNWFFCNHSANVNGPSQAIVMVHKHGKEPCTPFCDIFQNDGTDRSNEYDSILAQYRHPDDDKVTKEE